MSSPPSQTVNYNTVLRMTCRAVLGRPTTNPGPTTITWYDSTNMTMDNSSAGVTVYNRMYTTDLVYLQSDLVVNDIGLQHLGELSCIVSNSLGLHVARWNITPSQEYVEPQGASISNTSQTLNCDDEVTIVCRAWGYPPPDITWILNGTNIEDGNQMDTLGLNYTDSRLVISQFSTPNFGTYVCLATNDVGSSMSTPGT